jgi:ATP phosphoribosyltransferase regulatory subunit
LLLALDCLAKARLAQPTVDLADVRIANAILSQTQLTPSLRAQIHATLASKDSAEMALLAQGFDASTRNALLALMDLYGDSKVLLEARKVLPALPQIEEALLNLQWLARHLEGVQVHFDLADLGGYAYYSGLRFAIYAAGSSGPIVRGGRYDEIGAAFGRKRPAVGFSLDIKTLVEVVEPRPLHPAIRADWSEAPAWSCAVAALRQQGETVVCQLPGHPAEIDEFNCDRELVEVAGQWVLKAI